MLQTAKWYRITWQANSNRVWAPSPGYLGCMGAFPVRHVCCFSDVSQTLSSCVRCRRLFAGARGLARCLSTSLVTAGPPFHVACSLMDARRASHHLAGPRVVPSPTHCLPVRATLGPALPERRRQGKRTPAAARCRPLQAVWLPRRRRGPPRPLAEAPSDLQGWPSTDGLAGLQMPRRSAFAKPDSELRGYVPGRGRLGAGGLGRWRAGFQPRPVCHPLHLLFSSELVVWVLPRACAVGAGC